MNPGPERGRLDRSCRAKTRLEHAHRTEKETGNRLGVQPREDFAVWISSYEFADNVGVEQAHGGSAQLDLAVRGRQATKGTDLPYPGVA